MNQEYEYITTLSPEEKKAFLDCFCCMICSDKQVAKEEIEFLKNIGKMYEVPEKDIVAIMKNLNRSDIIENIGTRITERKKALQLIKELCFLANSDSGLDDAEIDFIIDIAERLNIENEKIKQINKWVLDKIVLLRTGDIILENE